jgi:hypothetical protein
MSYKLVNYSPDLNLGDFYEESKKRGLENNCSQSAMFDCFRNEKKWAGWLVEYNQRFIGGVCIHSFEDVMGPDSYRIYARACFHTELSEKPTGYITDHFRKLQNVGLQLFTPVSIEWAGLDKKFYGSSNSRNVGSSRTVNDKWFPRLADMGIFTWACEVEYRGHMQNIWQLNTEEYLKQIKKVPLWNCQFPSKDLRLDRTSNSIPN